MSAERLADPRIQRFLASRDVAVLATVKPDGGPAAMAMWFLHEPDALTMITVDGLAKVRHLRRDPRVCVVAEAGGKGPDIRGVSVQGRVEFVADPGRCRPLADRLLDKYHPRLEALWGGRVMPADRVMFRIVPERVRSWGLG